MKRLKWIYMDLLPWTYFSMQTQGMVMIVTMEEQEDDIFNDQIINMKVH